MMERQTEGQVLLLGRALHLKDSQVEILRRELSDTNQYISGEALLLVKDAQMTQRQEEEFMPLFVDLRLNIAERVDALGPSSEIARDYNNGRLNSKKAIMALLRAQLQDHLSESQYQAIETGMQD